jgi:hypothetical protein
MEGTQMPMKMAAYFSPLKYNTSEKIKERKADINNSLSVIENFLNMVFIFFIEQCQGYLVQKKYNLIGWVGAGLYFLLGFYDSCKANVLKCLPSLVRKVEMKHS